MVEMHDSGKREEFETGAVRDTAEGKPRLGLISPFALRRLGTWLALGARKYADHNWARGMPFSRVLDSLERHVQAFKAGEEDEDHLAAVMCNAMFLIHYQEGIKQGFLPSCLDDMPDYSNIVSGSSTCVDWAVKFKDAVVIDELLLSQGVNQ